MKTISLTVNGQPRLLEVGETDLLVDVLRDQFGLASVRESCGVGMCGACTVLLDGRPISACLALAALQDGHSVLTLEGLGQAGQLHPVQAAFLEHEAFQCGYCTPGFIVAAAALLEEQPRPTAQQVRAYLSGNLCRCGAYPEILEAILSVAR